MWPAAAPAALRPWDWVAPAASAAAFLAAPASSTPIGSFDCSQTTPARVKTAAMAAESRASVEAATRPAPSVTISCACAGPPMHATREPPRLAPSSTLGAVPGGGPRRPGRADPVRRHEPLGERDHRRATVEPALGEARDHAGERHARHTEEAVVDAAEAVVGGLDPQVARELDAREVDRVLPVAIQRPALLARTRLQRGA